MISIDRSLFRSTDSLPRTSRVNIRHSLLNICSVVVVLGGLSVCMHATHVHCHGNRSFEVRFNAGSLERFC